MGFFGNVFARLFGRAPKKGVPAAEAPEAREQAVYGELVAAGACEFVAKTPLGEIRGTWRGDDDAPAGTRVKIVLPPEIFRIDECPPEENFFRLADAGTLRVAAAADFSGDPEDAFVWFFPEDAQGFPAEGE